MRFTIPETTTGQFTFPNGTVKHYQKGKKQGWVTLPNGIRKHYHNNTLHNVGQPTIIYPDGKTEWYEYGVKIATVYFKEQYQEDGNNIVHQPYGVAAIWFESLPKYSWTVSKRVFDGIGIKITYNSCDTNQQGFVVVNGTLYKNGFPIDVFYKHHAAFFRTHTDEVKQMTIEQIEEALGHKVSIVSK